MMADRDIEQATDKYSALCQQCLDGDHSNHNRKWGGICIGCGCGWLP